MDTCVLYLRKSDENAEADDFDIQEQVCRKYAEDKGYAIVEIYREAHSGKHSPGTRVVLRQAMLDIKHHKANVLVIRSYDRLARTVEQTYAILFEIEQLYHGRVEAAQEGLDRTSATAKIQFAVLAAASELERDRIYERMEAGKRKRAERGNLMGSPNPRYGYQWADDTPGHRTRYDVDQHTAPVVRQIFTMAASGQSTRSIAKELNSQGTVTPSTYAAQYHNPGKRMVARFWHAEQVRVILEDPRYAGKPVAFRYKTKQEYRDDREREYEVRTIREDAIPLSTDVWPALISPEQFEVVQQRLKTNVAGRRPAEVQAALLRGHVYCGCCGRRMAPMKAGGGYYVYACRKRRASAADPAEACPGGGFNIRCHIVDAIGWEHVVILMESEQDFAKLLYDRMHAHPSEDVTAQAQAAIGALRLKEEQQANLADTLAMTNSAAVRKSLVEKMEAIAGEIEKQQKLAREAQKKVDDDKAGDAVVEDILRSLYGWHGTGVAPEESENSYAKLPYDKKRLAISASGLHVDLYPTGWRKDGKRVVPWFDVKSTTSSSSVCQFTIEELQAVA